MSKAVTFVAGARLTLVLDSQPDWTHSNHTRNWSAQQHPPVANAVLHLQVRHIMPLSVTDFLPIHLQMFCNYFIGQLVWSTENVHEAHFVVGIFNHDPVSVDCNGSFGQQAGFVMEVFKGEQIISILPLQTLDGYTLLLEIFNDVLGVKVLNPTGME